MDDKHKHALYVCGCFYAELRHNRKPNTCLCLYGTCNMVTTCLSPVFVQTGAIPNFTATNPTLRLPGKRHRWKDGLSASQQEKASWWTDLSLIMTPTLCPLMSLPGLIFEWVKLFGCLPSVLLCHAFPHVLLVILCEVFIKPRCGLYCPNTAHQKGRAAKKKRRRNLGK